MDGRLLVTSYSFRDFADYSEYSGLPSLDAPPLASVSSPPVSRPKASGFEKKEPTVRQTTTQEIAPTKPATMQPIVSQQFKDRSSEIALPRVSIAPAFSEQYLEARPLRPTPAETFVKNQETTSYIRPQSSTSTTTPAQTTTPSRVVSQEDRIQKPVIRPVQVQKAVQTVPERKFDPILTQKSLPTVLVNPKKQPPRLTQQSIPPSQVYLPPTSQKSTKSTQADLPAQTEAPRGIREEDLRERENRIIALKELNGKLAIRNFLTSVELMRKDTMPAPQPQVIVQQEAARFVPVLTTESLAKYYVEPKLKTFKSFLSTTASQTDPIVSKPESVAVKDNAEVENLKKENQELKDIIVNRIRTSSSGQQSHDLAELRGEISRLRKLVEEYETRAADQRDEEVSALDNRELKRKLEDANDELKRVKDMWNRDKMVVRDMSLELERALAEIDRLKAFNASQQRLHDAERAQLQSKIAKRDIARKELEQIIDELERLKRDKDKLEHTRTRQNEDLIMINQKLKHDLQIARDELEAMRKLFAEEQKRSRQPIGRTVNTPKKLTKVSSLDDYDRGENPGMTSDSTGKLLLQKMLLGIEVCRLNFAYGGCRCGKAELPVTESGKKQPVDESPFVQRREDRDNTAKKVLQPVIQPSQAEDSGQLSTVIKERDNLKVLLADYQRKLLEARRTIDALRADKGEQENVAQQNAPQTSKVESCSDPSCKSKMALRELELKNKILAAENSKLTSILGTTKGSRVA